MLLDALHTMSATASEPVGRAETRRGGQGRGTCSPAPPTQPEPRERATEASSQAAAAITAGERDDAGAYLVRPPSTNLWTNSSEQISNSGRG